MSVTGNRAAFMVATEIVVRHKEDVIELSDEELRKYVIEYIKDWSSEDKARFVDQIILEIKDFFGKIQIEINIPF